jgi:hypothetical protein
MKKREVFNIEKMAKDNPLILLAEAIADGTSKMIENQEAQGQVSFVSSTTLPTDMPDDAREILEKAGVIFGDVVEGDPMFQHVELPEGWQKVKTDHSMWSDLVDDKGRKRAGIFYKAAFYDRSAHLSLLRRYSYNHDYERRDTEGIYVELITDCGETIHETEPLTKSGGENSYQTRDKSTALAIAWLDEHYPDWQDAGAYWD